MSTASPLPWVTMSTVSPLPWVTMSTVSPLPGFSSPRLSPRLHHQARDHTDTQTTPPRGSRTNLESSSASSFFSSHASSTRLPEGEGLSGRGHHHGSTRRRDSPHRCPHFPSLSLLGFGGDFSTLETRLQKALDSSSLQVSVGVWVCASGVLQLLIKSLWVCDLFKHHPWSIFTCCGYSVLLF
jgi:hypothetical protein